MSVTIKINNDQDFPILNSGEVDLDFTFNQFSPNANIVSSFVAQFVCSPSSDPITYIREQMTVTGVAKNLQAQLNVDDGFFTVDGQLNLSSPDNSFIFGQGQKSQFDIKFDPYPNLFFDKSKDLSIAKFSDKNNWEEVRYVTERDSKIEDILILIITYQTLQQVAQQVYNTSDLIKEAVNTGFDTASAVIKFSLKLAMNLIYIVAILLALNELLKQTSEVLFDKPKKLYALDVWQTLIDGCRYLGYNFESSLQADYANLTFLTATTTKGEVFDDPKNNPVPTYSFLQFIENIGALFNAKLKVTNTGGNNTVTFENVRYYENTPAENIKLLDLYNNGKKSFNFEELPEKITLKYAKVSGDINYKTNFYQESYSLKGAGADNILFGAKSSIDVNLSFAKAEKKTSQSSLEKAFNSIFDLLAGLSKSYKVKTGDRIGFLKLERDIVPQDTLLIRNSDGSVNDKTNTILKPKSLFQKFYNSESPVNNQFEITKERGKQPICGVNSNDLINNNVILDQNGTRNIIITKNIRQSQDGLYDIEYRKRLQAGDFGFVDQNLIDVKSVES
mgnify:CR=1 FL=1